MSSETNTTAGSSSLANETLSVTTSNDNSALAQEDSAEKQARKKQNRQNWKSPSKGDGKDIKASKPIVISDDNSNDNAEVLDMNVAQHQRRKSTANTPDISSKNKNSNNNGIDKSVHRRGKSMANVGELQGVSSKNGNGKSKGSKDDSENKSEALESLQQIIASLKSLPAVPSKPQKSDKKDDDSSADLAFKHKRHESSSSGTGKRTNTPSKQHKKGTSVSFSFPLTTAVTTSLKPILDSEDGKPIDIENALQDTISSLRRMSLDKGKNPTNRKSPNPDDMVQSSIDKKQELDSPKSPFDFKKSMDDQQQLTAKKTHRRHQSLGYTLSTSSSSTSIAKPNIPIHGRRHSVALNGSKDVLKELEKNQGRLAGPEVKGHRPQPFQPFPIPKFGAIQKKQQQNQQNSNNQQQRKSLFAPYLPQASLPPLLKSCQLVSGVLRINKRNRSDAYVATESLDADIYICGSKDRNRALEGDVVAVELLDPDKVWQTKKEKEEKKRKKEESAGIEKKKIDKKKDDVEVEGQGLLLFEDDDIVTDEQRPKYCGHVVAVMERMPGQLFSGPSSTATKEREAAEKARKEAEDRAAGIEPKVEEPREEKKDDKNERPKIVWFKPTDKRVPLIAIPTEQAPSDFVENHQSYAQQLFVACIKRWPITSLHPFGTLVTKIGEIGSIEVETEALLKDNNVSSEEFNENVTKCLPSTPWTIPEKEIETRRDLRSTTRIFSIDPPTAKDLDDAVSCSRLPDGNYEIGVHIADEVIEGKPLNSEVKIFNDYDAKEIEADIKGLSQRLREQRLKRGALSLGSIKLNFELDEHNNPIACNVYEHKDANQLIEEFMLLANMSVAQKISSAFPEQALLRRHAPPIERYDIDVSSAGALQRSFNAVEDNNVREVLKLLAIKPMQRAKYFCTGTLDIAKYHHYALNVPLYTHFTSPIRRYADVLVHRMLEAALSGEKRFYLDKDAVQKTANHCNVKKEAAKNAQEQSSHLFLCVLLHNLAVQSGPVIREAIVIGVKDHAFDVLVPVFGIEKRVHLDQLPLEKFIFNAETSELTLHWKQGVNVNDDYHYELMDVSSLPIEDEHRLFDDANSDIGEDDIDDDEFPVPGDEENDSNDDTEIVAVPSMSSSESPKMDIPSAEAPSLNQAASTKSSLPIVKITELPQLPIVSDPTVPNSQIIKELCRLQVVITADCKKSPPVIKVLAVNPYA
ncbi:15982_t:CDS:10 [Racocetra fulgida]|uniref:15982_t:CDS:1 n=1 Tax=Racocetra fulgida TaxID=60492 RepID=A0A9N8VWA5_9GLOM|nr:15982_t:CDS:10 [Racocetra fulgida]